MSADPPSGDCPCGNTIARDRRDGFCSSWCRTRDARGVPPQKPPPLRPTVVVPLGDASAVTSSVTSSVGSTEPAGEGEPQRPRYRQRRRLIADEVEERLREADMLDTWQGAAALDLADSLDWQGGSGSARAALHRELNRQMTELLRGQDEAGSAVGSKRDELARRRERRGVAG